MLNELAYPLALTAHLILPPSHLLLALLSAIMPAADCGPESFNSHHLAPKGSPSMTVVLSEWHPNPHSLLLSSTEQDYHGHHTWPRSACKPTKGWVAAQGLWGMGPRMEISRMFRGQAIAAGLTAAKNQCPRKIHSADSKRDLSLLSRVFADLLPPLRRLWGWERQSPSQM